MAPCVRRITGIHARVQRGAFLSAWGSRKNELLPRSRTCFECVTTSRNEIALVVAPERGSSGRRTAGPAEPEIVGVPCGHHASELRSMNSG